MFRSIFQLRKLSQRSPFTGKHLQMRTRVTKTGLSGEISIEKPSDSAAHTTPISSDVDFWRDIPQYSDLPKDTFLSYRWQLANTVSTPQKLHQFLYKVLPSNIPRSRNSSLGHIQTKDDFVLEAHRALTKTTMAVRLTPYILSRIDWRTPLDDPIRLQFLPLESTVRPNHRHVTLDSLHEENDSPVPGLVHRYPGRALFLATSICPVYCRYCTRSYAIGADTDLVTKKMQKPSRKRWDVIFQYIENDMSLVDIVVSGGDAYYLAPDQLREIGQRLLNIPHIKIVRFASKGLGVAPSRIVDPSDSWADALIALSNQGRKIGKQVCLHTHINHTQEISWVTARAANRLFAHGVTVRNQAVLLKGVNNSFGAISDLIRSLANINIVPYYVYQCDMVPGIEDLRTPLSEIIELDKKTRGTFSGFLVPNFVIDLPGGGGKRLVSTFESYDKERGVASYRAPGLPGIKGSKVYHYYDPLPIE